MKLFLNNLRQMSVLEKKVQGQVGLYFGLNKVMANWYPRVRREGDTVG